MMMFGLGAGAPVRSGREATDGASRGTASRFDRGALHAMANRAKAATVTGFVVKTVLVQDDARWTKV
jgi:hypothetical protein